MPRHQPPVHSPIGSRALLSGSRALVDGEAARERAGRRIREALAPLDLLFTDSGTSALTLALRAATALRPGPVALPAYSCYDVATAAEGAGVAVELYDLDPRTLSPDIASLASALRRGAGTVVVAHLYGMPADLPAARSLCREADALLVEDAAQGAGSRIAGDPAGSVGSVAVLSFGRGKGTTGGGGGALLAHDETGREVLERARSGLQPARGRGAGALLRAAAQWLLGRPEVYALPASLPGLPLGETLHHAPTAARDCPEVCLGILAETWPLAESELRVRREHAGHLRRSLSGHPEMSPVRPLANARPGYLRLPVLASARVRGLATETKAERLGIMPGYPRPLGELPEFADRCGNPDEILSGARDLSAHLLTFPTHGRLDGDDLRRLDRWIEDTAGDA